MSEHKDPQGKFQDPQLEKLLQPDLEEDEDWLPELELPELENIKLLISYDGTEYHGWQRQPGRVTIQEKIEENLRRILRERINLQAAGRTDAGVHALAQVANFRANCRLTDLELVRALNATLPYDIRIMAAERVPFSFHSRKSAKSKVYRYRIRTSAIISPFDYRYMLHYPYPLDVEAMQRASSRFEREDDFSAFSSSKYRNPVRKVFRATLERAEDELVFTIEATGFLRYMVRTIVGTLIMVGRGKLKPEDVETLFQGKKRTTSSPTAPAKGLCLVKVNY